MRAPIMRALWRSYPPIVASPPGAGHRESLMPPACQARGDVRQGGMRSLIRVRMDRPHYAGLLVDGAHMLALFGDVATELCVLADGDEGLFRAYDSVEFLAPVYAGDFIEAEGEVVGWGRTSLKMRFEARKVIGPVPGAGLAET